MKKGIYLACAFLVSSALYAQTAFDALKYSQTTIGGTARSTAMGGAFGALGGDFSTLSTNPAGIATYRSSEFTISSEVNYTENSSLYFYPDGKDMSTMGATEDRYNFNVQNFGYVATFKPYGSNNSGLVSTHFGFGMNSLANFNNSMIIEGRGVANSMTDYFANKTQGIRNYGLIFEEGEYDPYQASDLGPAFYESIMAYETGIIRERPGFDPDDPDSRLNVFDYDPILSIGELVDQRLTLTEQGHINEYIFSFGANFGYKVQVGASMGIQDLYYKKEYTYSEAFGFEGSGNGSFVYNDYLKTTGTGYNFKLGVLLRLTDAFRIGGAIHSPTFYRLSDTYYSSMSQNGMVQDDYIPEHNIYTETVTPKGKFEYNLRTPFKAIGSAALVLNKHLILSGEYEYIDYTTMKLSENGSSSQFNKDNGNIKSLYRATHNFRAGAEMRLNNYVSLRGGYNFQMSPYRDKNSGINYQTHASYVDYIGDLTQLTGGIGIHDKNYFFDIAYIYSTQDQEYATYALPDGESMMTNSAEVDYTNHRVMFTLGFKF